MTTNNLANLATMLPIASAKPFQPCVSVNRNTYIHSFIQQENIEDINLVRTIQKRYSEAIQHHRDKIASVFSKIYLIVPKVKEENLGNIVIKINEMTKRKASPEIMAERIRKHLKYDCPFYRIREGKREIITSDTIETAYDMILHGDHPMAVKYALYFNF